MFGTYNHQMKVVWGHLHGSLFVTGDAAKQQDNKSSSLMSSGDTRTQVCGHEKFTGRSISDNDTLFKCVV